MKKYARIAMFTMATIGIGASSLTFANSGVPLFVKQASPKNATFNCSFKGKTANGKCSVHQVSKVNDSNNNSVILNSLIGRNSSYELLTVRWPTGDVSRFALIPNMQVVNLANNRILTLKTEANNKMSLDLAQGLVMQQNGEEHTRLW